MSTEWSDTDWQKAQKLVLQRLHAKYDAMSEFQRKMPVIHFQDEETMESILLSPADAILEVEALSALGKKVIVAYVKLLQRMQPEA